MFVAETFDVYTNPDYVYSTPAVVTLKGSSRSRSHTGRTRRSSSTATAKPLSTDTATATSRKRRQQRQQVTAPAVPKQETAEPASPTAERSSPSAPQPNASTDTTAKQHTSRKDSAAATMESPSSKRRRTETGSPTPPPSAVESPTDEQGPHAHHHRPPLHSQMHSQTHSQMHSQTHSRTHSRTHSQHHSRTPSAAVSRTDFALAFTHNPNPPAVAALRSPPVLQSPPPQTPTPHQQTPLQQHPQGQGFPFPHQAPGAAAAVIDPPRTPPLQTDYHHQQQRQLPAHILHHQHHHQHQHIHHHPPPLPPSSSTSHQQQQQQQHPDPRPPPPPAALQIPTLTLDVDIETAVAGLSSPQVRDLLAGHAARCQVEFPSASASASAASSATGGGGAAGGMLRGMEGEMTATLAAEIRDAYAAVRRGRRKQGAFAGGEVELEPPRRGDGAAGFDDDGEEQFEGEGREGGEGAKVGVGTTAITTTTDESMAEDNDDDGGGGDDETRNKRRRRQEEDEVEHAAVDFSPRGRSVWREVNITHRGERSSAQWAAGADVYRYIRETVEGVGRDARFPPPGAAFATRRNALVTLRKMGKTVYLAGTDAVGSRVLELFQAESKSSGDGGSGGAGAGAGGRGGRKDSGGQLEGDRPSDVFVRTFEEIVDRLSDEERRAVLRHAQSGGTFEDKLGELLDMAWEARIFDGLDQVAEKLGMELSYDGDAYDTDGMSSRFSGGGETDDERKPGGSAFHHHYVNHEGGLDFAGQRKSVWRELNVTHSGERVGRQREAAFDSFLYISSIIRSVQRAAAPPAPFSTRRNALVALRKMGKSIVLSGGCDCEHLIGAANAASATGPLPREVRRQFRDDGVFAPACMEIAANMSAREKRRMLATTDPRGVSFESKLEELIRLAQSFSVMDGLDDCLKELRRGAM